MNQLLDSFTSILGFGLDLLWNQPAYNFPVPAAGLAAAGVIAIFFAATRDIFADFSAFGDKAGAIVAMALAGICYLTYLKDEGLVMMLCTFLFVTMRVIEGAMVGKVLAGPLGIVIAIVAIAMIVVAFVGPIRGWIQTHQSILATWNVLQAVAAAHLAASIQLEFGSLKSKELLFLGFLFMLLASSLSLPNTPDMKRVNAWAYAVPLLLSFGANVINRRTMPRASPATRDGSSEGEG